jgi:hypothetical protein
LWWEELVVGMETQAEVGERKREENFDKIDQILQYSYQHIVTTGGRQVC